MQLNGTIHLGKRENQSKIFIIIPIKNELNIGFFYELDITKEEADKLKANV